MLTLRGQSGLEAKILASAFVSVSELWPRPLPWPQTFGLGLASVYSRRTSSQEETDQFATTGHRTIVRVNGQMIDDRENKWERMRNESVLFRSWLCRFSCMLSIIIWYFLFITFSLASVLASATVSASRLWPRLTSLPEHADDGSSKCGNFGGALDRNMHGLMYSPDGTNICD